ncbi:MAG TPA: ABC transporter permease [Thermoanaerobaculia bacterium]|nr:ABC transporter permease [Thermoanaerobaculia bacterium]
MFDLLIQSVPLAIVAATPLLLTVQGELIVQRSGTINLGVEGMLLAAAFGAASTSSIAGGVAGAAVVALIFGVLTIQVRADQIVTGTAINLLVLGLTGFLYREWKMAAPPPFGFDFVTPLAWVVVPLLVAFFLWNTSAGLRLRASGENPEALAAPRRYRWLALACQALLVGFAGAHLALALSNGFAENMSAGRGFIALAVVIFGRWTVGGAVLGTAVFGIAAALQYAMQAANQGIAFHILLAMPYVVTLLILCGVTGHVRAPEALGRR